MSVLSFVVSALLSLAFMVDVNPMWLSSSCWS